MILSTVAVQFLEGVVTLPSIDATTLSIIWQPPLSPNGDIRHYNIRVDNRKNDTIKYPLYNFTVDAISGQKFYSLQVTDLGIQK